MAEVSTVPTLELHDGVEIPQLGFGVFQIPPEQTQAAVEEALAAGYRHVDTAAAYRNEAAVGDAIAASGIPREDVFVTTKLWNSEQGFDSTLRAFEASLRQLGLERVDLYLIHWPLPGEDRYLDTWRAFERIRDEGRARSIGVSNFRLEDLSGCGMRPRRCRPSTRSSCTRACSRPSCAPGTPSTESPRRPGARWPRASCWTRRRSSRSPPTTSAPRPR